MQLTQLLADSEPIKQIDAALAADKGPVAVFGAGGVAATALTAALALHRGGGLAFVCASDAQCVRAAADMRALGVAAEAFCSREPVLLDVESTSHDDEYARLAALDAAGRGVLCVSAESLLTPTVPPDVYRGACFDIACGAALTLDELAARLVRAGYRRVDTVESSGQFAVRGGIADVFVCSHLQPLRLEFWGDSIESVSEFDPDTQRRTRKLDIVRITPARELLLGDPLAAADKLDSYAASGLPAKLESIVRRDSELLRAGATLESADRYMPLFYKKRAAVLDYLDGTPVVIDDYSAVLERIKNTLRRIADDLLALGEQGLVDKSGARYFNCREPDFTAQPLAVFENFTRQLPFEKLAAVIPLKSAATAAFSGEFSALREDVAALKLRGFRIAVLAATQRAAAALCDDFTDSGISCRACDDISADDAVCVSQLNLSAGFELETLHVAVIAARRQSAPTRSGSRSYRRQGRGIGSLEDLNVGDYVVHVNHGIGVFDGIHRIDYRGTVKDYIKIRYRGSDIIYVPVTQLDMVTQYTAPSDAAPPQLAKLHSGEWANTKQKVYNSARDMAKELIALYAERSKKQGIQFSADGDWQRDFELRFEYDETEDQLRSIAEIKRDMTSPQPMDRLLCGDVGVGKTEVALRAAFKCVNDGYQVAVLVPTTILAWQHYQSFLERLGNYPLSVAMLSRFTSRAQMTEAVKGIADGTVDIAIGTHRLLQKDIKFKRLGLLIIDEEQRFGVAHKEKLKQAFTGVDVLTLSATPIPRTLNMAMSGVRDMSVIEQAPRGRQPVQTYVMEYDSAVVADAVRRELARGGQVYYLHNRVDTIERCAAKLSELVPDARIAVAHGRMDETELSRVWQKLINDEIDVLVCTTIIETGVDVPNCNTLIVENADNMGLAQLYQLRGRVGRSDRRAYAYFTFRRERVLTEVAAKRLAAIRDFTGFGSGMKIALRDLQIRGAGGILSARQSGHMQAVGYDMYLKILSDAVRDEQGVADSSAAVDCLVDLPVDAYIPDSYIPDGASRIEIYKKIAAVDSADAADELRAELRDRFGEPPQCVGSLLAVALLRGVAAAIGIYEIKERDGTAYMYWDNIDIPAVRRLTTRKLRPLNLCVKGKSYISAALTEGENAAEALLTVCSALQQCAQDERAAVERAAALVQG